jgi:hypothetical protein
MIQRWSASYLSSARVAQYSHTDLDSRFSQDPPVRWTGSVNEHDGLGSRDAFRLGTGDEGSIGIIFFFFFGGVELFRAGWKTRMFRRHAVWSVVVSDEPRECRIDHHWTSFEHLRCIARDESGHVESTILEKCPICRLPNVYVPLKPLGPEDGGRGDMHVSTDIGVTIEHYLF